RGTVTCERAADALGATGARAAAAGRRGGALGTCRPDGALQRAPGAATFGHLEHVRRSRCNRRTAAPRNRYDLARGLGIRVRGFCRNRTRRTSRLLVDDLP